VFALVSLDVVLDELAGCGAYGPVEVPAVPEGFSLEILDQTSPNILGGCAWRYPRRYVPCKRSIRFRYDQGQSVEQRLSYLAV
jgi:hypothetical protein